MIWTGFLLFLGLNWHFNTGLPCYFSTNAKSDINVLSYDARTRLLIAGNHYGEIFTCELKKDNLYMGLMYQSPEKTLKMDSIYQSPRNSQIIKLVFILQGNYFISFEESGEIILWRVSDRKQVDKQQLVSFKQVVYTNDNLITIDPCDGVNYWKALADINATNPKLPLWQLTWSTKPVSSVEHANIYNVKDLNPEDKYFLKQSGAIENENTKTMPVNRMPDLSRTNCHCGAALSLFGYCCKCGK